MSSGFIGDRVRSLADQRGIVLDPEKVAEERRQAKARRQAEHQQAVAAYWQSLRRGEATSWAPVEEPADTLSPCASCLGARWVRDLRTPADPDFGRVRPCRDCGQDVQDWRRRLIARATGISEEQMAQTFDRFQRRRGTEAALAAAQAFARHPVGWLVIHGPVGTGKTHLSNAVVNALIDDGLAVTWWYAADLAAAFRKAIADNRVEQLAQTLKDAGVLVIDDLGSAQVTDFVMRQGFEPVFNFRERHHLPTVVTCIGDPEAVKEHVSESIGRRFQDPRLCTVVRITATQFGLSPDA